MFLKGSRYEAARAFVSEDGTAPFPGVRAREIAPAPPVLEHTVQAGDRLDRLARHYYNDDRLWWRIVDANPEFFYGADLLREKADQLQVSYGKPACAPEDRDKPVVAEGFLCLDRMVGRAILIPRARG
jgi:nucleoid-associated protein YgaU